MSDSYGSNCDHSHQDLTNYLSVLLKKQKMQWKAQLVMPPNSYIHKLY